MFRVLLSIEIRNSCNSGIEIESFIESVSSVIEDKASYKFRVFGEAKIIAIFEDNDDSVVNTVTADIMRKGPYNVTCTPLTGIEKLAFIVGLKSNKGRLSEKYVVWFELPMDIHGILPEWWHSKWTTDVRSIIEKLQHISTEIEIFKVLGERRFYIFTSKQHYEEFETQLPMGDKSKILTQILE